METIRIGILGAGYISRVHTESFKTVPGVEIVAVCDQDADRGKALCEVYKIPRYYSDHKELLKDKDVSVVTIALPNYLHAPMAIAAAKAGKHVICEKPLALSIEDAEAMIEACKKAGVVLAYAEELCFIPKFVRTKEIVESGGVGKVYMIKQCEKHGGPYSPWFWEPEEAGGGILMDMGCHSIEFCRWFMGKPKVKSVFAQMNTYVHGDKTKEEDHVIVLIEFEGGEIALCESSWALQGGMDSVVEVYGTEGVIYGDLLRGMGLRVYSKRGYDAPTLERTDGWSFPDYEWLWNNGYPQEMAHFIECIRSGKEPVESGKDGIAVLEIMLAAYESAATGRKVPLPFRPKGIHRPIDLWLKKK